MRMTVLTALVACCAPQLANAQSAPPPGMRMPEPILRQLSKDAVADGPIKEVRIYHDSLPPGMTTPWHTHDASPMYYVVTGRFTLEFKDHRPDAVVHAGEGFVEPVGVVLRGRSGPDGPTEYVIVQVSDPAKPFLRMVAP